MAIDENRIIELVIESTDAGILKWEANGREFIARLTSVSLTTENVTYRLFEVGNQRCSNINLGISSGLEKEKMFFGGGLSALYNDIRKRVRVDETARWAGPLERALAARKD